jgi:hypothetical protein
MKTRWFQICLWIFCIFGIVGLLLMQPVRSLVYAQDAATDSATPGGSTPFITNIFEGEPAINVRTGPSTIFYPDPCGSLPYGATAPAIGSSPAHEWILILYKDCPNGQGWIYAPNVQLSPGYLPVVEPPPTATPIASATIDPTLAAAFTILPTVTRLPTFTPASPLTIPTFAPAEQTSPAVLPIGGIILGITLVGLLVFMVSFLGRR